MGIRATLIKLDALIVVVRIRFVQIQLILLRINCVIQVNLLIH